MNHIVKLSATNSSEPVREHFWALGSPCYQGPCVQMECVILQGGNGPAWKLANCADQHHFICTNNNQRVDLVNAPTKGMSQS